jgi:hypothetical protein
MRRVDTQLNLFALKPTRVVEECLGCQGPIVVREQISDGEFVSEYVGAAGCAGSAAFRLIVEQRAAAKSSPVGHRSPLPA